MNMAGAVRAPRKRRTQERAEVTRGKLLDTAIRLFSERGYDAVSVREIEVAAEVQRNLLQYHFGGKEGMWKAAAAECLTNIQGFSQERQDLMKDLPVHERIAYQIRSYVRFSAQQPAFNRMMMQEGKHDSWRLEWLSDTYLKPAMEHLREIVLEDVEIEEEEFIHWYYMFVSAGSFIFSMAPEAKHMFGVDVSDEGIIDRQAQLMVEFLLSRQKE
ncbi:MAG: helix-turn-helix domain-containing protein [Pseudomonadota bacterium]